MKSKDERKLNIAMFGQKRIPSREGGVEIVVEELATRMAKLGHNVTCYNRAGHHVSGNEFDKKIEKEYKGVRLKTVWTIDKKGLAAMTSSLSAAICSAFSKTDVVHIHAEGPAAMCFIPKLFGKKVIATIHGLDWQRAKWGGFARKYIKWGEKQAVKYADEIIVLSKNVQEYFKKAYNRETIYIPNGINKPELRPAKEIINKWGLIKDSYVLYLGRIVPEKGIQYLIEAWKEIKTDKKLVICGGSSDTEKFMNELKGMTRELNNVIFVGFQQGRILEELFSNAYIYCLPSDVEGMPLSLLEAMSYGNCCVVSDIPECTEVVENKAVEFVKSNIQDLRHKLNELIQDEDMVRLYKADSSKYVCDRFNWNDIVERTIGLYKS